MTKERPLILLAQGKITRQEYGKLVAVPPSKTVRDAMKWLDAATKWLDRYDARVATSTARSPRTKG